MRTNYPKVLGEDLTTVHRRLFLFPAWRSNPYLMMNTLAAEAAGWGVEGGRRLEELVEGAAGLGRGDVLHVHWTAPVTAHAADLAEAERNMAVFDEVLEGVRNRGADILWTVHNEITHDAPYEAVEIHIAESLVRWSSRVIQLHDRTAHHLERSYTLPADRLVTLRHASYAGLYPVPPDRVTARKVLGIDADVPTVGLIGQIRPYKGVEVFLDAAELASQRLGDLTVLLAGNTAPDYRAEIEGRIPPGLNLVRHHEFLDDAEMAVWLEASNVLALPYRRILNSGSALLAATFGRPVIIPDDSPLAEVYADERWVETYQVRPDPVSTLAERIVELAPGDPAREESALAFAAAYTPYDMSRDYLRILESLGGDL